MCVGKRLQQEQNNAEKQLPTHAFIQTLQEEEHKKQSNSDTPGKSVFSFFFLFFYFFVIY